MKILIAGGGTGGHLFPGIAVGEEFKEIDNNNEILFVGSAAGIEGRLLPELGLPHVFISASGIRGKGAWGRIKGTAAFLMGYSDSRKILKVFKPDAVLGVGGYASAPMLMAARGMLIPCFVHEQNAIPGMTNRIIGRFSVKNFISIPGSERFFPDNSTILTGNPVRKELLCAVGSKVDSEAGDFHILVFGGSAGAHAINMAMIEALPHLSELRGKLKIVHQSGKNDDSAVKSGYSAAGFECEVTPFIYDMAAAYSKADLVICRAGATSIAETSACGKPCIFIPYPYATDDHQRRNAEALLGAGACRMLVERDLSGKALADEIIDLEGNRTLLKRMSAEALNLAKPDASKVIAAEIVKYIMRG